MKKTKRNGRCAGWLLGEAQALFFRKVDDRNRQEGRPDVLWGWKRDRVEGGKRYPESRTVYFSADLELERNSFLVIKRAYFYLDSKAKRSEIESVYRKLSSYTGYSRLVVRAGSGTKYDLENIRRRLKGRPRINIPGPNIVSESSSYNLSGHAPFAVYVGSGLSAEAGLPVLGEMHKVFDVDKSNGRLVFGAMDTLPEKVVANPEVAFESFCQFNVDAICVEPSSSYRLLGNLYGKGLVRQVFTDNLDDIFMKLGVKYTQTRQGIFPDRFEVQFDSKVKSLLVIGVSADRREVVKQARRWGLKVIVINPVHKVSPRSRNMDYVRAGDIFFKGEAGKILPKIVSHSKFLI